MAVLVGIDEAGYGPILGPLVVSSFGLEMPDELIKADLWQVLSDAVGKQKRSLKGRLLVTDSKKAYDRKSGYGHLERTAVSLLGFQPCSVGELVEKLTEGSLRKLGVRPWYENIDATELTYNRDEIDVASGAFLRSAAAKGIRPVIVRSEVLDAGNYNELVELSHNKATVLFMLVCRHIAAALAQFPRANLQFIIDRQGGRDMYARPLGRMFPGMDITILKEDKICSSYALAGPAGSFKVHFIVKADLNYLGVSAASIVSKYIRELLMDALSGYFGALDERISPTAGYWQDGNRFIADIEKFLPQLKIDKGTLIRSR